MTSQILRKMAAVVAIVVGLVFATGATADAKAGKTTTQHTQPKITSVSTHMRTLDDWWW